MNLTKIGLLASVFVLFATPAFSSKWLQGYTTRGNPKRVYQRKNTSAGGSRSYCSDPLKGKSLSLLVPEEKVVHYSASAHPSFFFESKGAADTALLFTFVDPDVAEPLVESSIVVDEAGYYKISLPADIELVPGRIYFWHIAIPCSNDPDSNREVLAAAISIIPASEQLKLRLKLAETSSEKSKIYAEQGIWYDGVNYAMKANFPDFTLISLQK